MLSPGHVGVLLTINLLKPASLLLIVVLMFNLKKMYIIEEDIECMHTNE
jgi:hypothetical protein